jgi:hypothetical protein
MVDLLQFDDDVAVLRPVPRNRSSCGIPVVRHWMSVGVPRRAKPICRDPVFHEEADDSCGAGRGQFSVRWELRVADPFIIGMTFHRDPVRRERRGLHPVE